MSIHQAYSRNSVFRIYRNDAGRWCASKADGLVAGVFFERSAALRFAEREGARMQVLEDELLSRDGLDGRSPTIATC